MSDPRLQAALQSHQAGNLAEALRAWARAVAVRRGKRVAVVALARRLARILYALWRDGATYASAPIPAALAVAS